MNLSLGMRTYDETHIKIITALDNCLLLPNLAHSTSIETPRNKEGKCGYDLGNCGRSRYNCDELEAYSPWLMLKIKLKHMFAWACCLVGSNMHANGQWPTHLPPTTYPIPTATHPFAIVTYHKPTSTLISHLCGILIGLLAIPQPHVGPKFRT